MNCWHCGRAIAVTERVSFREYCPGCDRPLHVCRNCQFYDPAYHNQCREPQAELVADKERANFCEYFAPAKADRGQAAARSAKVDAQAKLRELFKKER